MKIHSETFRYFRHELRANIHIVIGQAELIEIAVNSAPHPELQEGAQALMSLANHLDEIFKALVQFDADRDAFFDMDQFKKAFVGPVFQVIGQAQKFKVLCESIQPAFVPELERILNACRSLLELVEKHSEIEVFTEYQAPLHEGREAAARPQGSVHGEILLVEDDQEHREKLLSFFKGFGFSVTGTDSGSEALRLLKEGSFDLVLLDYYLPGETGAELLEKIKAEPSLADIPVFIISALDDTQYISLCLRKGAEDFISKRTSPVLLRTKVENAIQRKQKRSEQMEKILELVQFQASLEKELSDAAHFVQSFLPRKEQGRITTDYVFLPSKRLGGDVFDYCWIDPDLFIFYLLDVCGHGISASMLSIIVMSLLRSRNLSVDDLSRPNRILEVLNASFQLEMQSPLYLTLWYGAYRPSTRELIYSSAGAPPAILVYRDGNQVATEQLGTTDLIIGIDPSYQYELKRFTIPPSSRLYLFSDGVYEVKNRMNRQMLTFRKLVELLSQTDPSEGGQVQAVYNKIVGLVGTDRFQDDFTLLEIGFE